MCALDNLEMKDQTVELEIRFFVTSWENRKLSFRSRSHHVRVEYEACLIRGKHTVYHVPWLVVRSRVISGHMCTGIAAALMS